MHLINKKFTIARHYAAFIDIDDIFWFCPAIVFQNIKIPIDCVGGESGLEARTAADAAY
jgi:hypothetical protein